jgi:MFS superfamily sulfate permease-like transporter
MKDNVPRAEIDMAKIPADDNVGGLLVAIATVVVFLIGIPAIRILFPMAILAGCAIAVVLHFFRRGPRGSTALHF